MATPSFWLFSRYQYHVGAGHRLAVKVRDNPRHTPSLPAIPSSCCHTFIPTVASPNCWQKLKCARTSSSSTSAGGGAYISCGDEYMAAAAKYHEEPQLRSEVNNFEK